MNHISEKKLRPTTLNTQRKDLKSTTSSKSSQR